MANRAGQPGMAEKRIRAKAVTPSPPRSSAITWFMLKNRSVPADVILPHLTYENVADAVVWLTRTFGFIEHYRYGEPHGRVQGAQMHLGEAWIMLNSPRPGRASPARLKHDTQSLTVFVEDVDASLRTSQGGRRHHRRGTQRDRLRRTAVRGPGPGGPSLALLAARAGCKPGGMGRGNREQINDRPRERIPNGRYLCWFSVKWTTPPNVVAGQASLLKLQLVSKEIRLAGVPGFMPKCEAPGTPISVDEHTCWYPGTAAKVRILHFKKRAPFRHYRGLQNHV